MAEPRVSVIIPAYRCATIIGRALDSVFAQTRPADEVIVVDDGSPDDLAGALVPYAGRLRVLRKSNGGASSARNAGIEACTGDLVAFLDSDDFWDSGKLAEQLEVLRRHQEVGLVASRYTILSPDGATEFFPGPGAARWDSVLHLAGPAIFNMAMLIWTSSVIMRRAVLGDLRFDEHFRIAEDRDLWVRMASRAPIYLQSRLTATLVELQGSLSHSDVDLDCRSMLQMIRRYQHLLGSGGVRRWEASVHRRWAAAYLGTGQSRRAIRPAFRRLIYQPFSPEGWWVLGKSMALAAAPQTLMAGAQHAAM